MSRYLISGGAGFLGFHLSQALLNDGHEVTGVDNFATGSHDNVKLLTEHDQFDFIEADVTQPFELDKQVDFVLHFASAASPPDYMALPVETLRVGSLGTELLLQLAKKHDARFLMASTSEIYGDPTQHPQTESYWGNVNSVGPRSVYDEAKRYAEAITVAYQRTHEVDTRIIRIFNTYGPRMRANDGRVVSNFIIQALQGKPLTVYGEGSQTRSFCYVDDEVTGILGVLHASHSGPVNVGSPHEFTVLELAQLVIDELGSDSKVEYEPLPADDPVRRQPDISLIQSLCGWNPTTSLIDGVRKTADYFRTQL